MGKHLSAVVPAVAVAPHSGPPAPVIAIATRAKWTWQISPLSAVHHHLGPTSCSVPTPQSNLPHLLPIPTTTELKSGVSQIGALTHMCQQVVPRGGPPVGGRAVYPPGTKQPKRRESMNASQCCVLGCRLAEDGTLLYLFTLNNNNLIESKSSSSVPIA